MDLLSISIVIFNPNMSVLEKVFLHMAQTLLCMSAEFSGDVSLTIISNAPDKQIGCTALGLARKRLPETLAIHYLHCPKNTGYGDANNKAISSSHAKYHLVLNPDVYMNHDTLLQCVRFMNTHEEVALCSPAVFSEDRSRQYLCKRNPTLFDGFLRAFAPGFVKNKFAKRMQSFEYRDVGYDKILFNVPFLTGCFMFFRTNVLEAISGFDARFFLYYEDADITRSILQLAQTAYVPDIQITHVWRRETYKSLRMKLITISSALKYWWKWGGIFKGTE